MVLLKDLLVISFSSVSKIEGNKIKLEKSAINNVTATNTPKATVPPNSEKTKKYQNQRIILLRCISYLLRFSFKAKNNCSFNTPVCFA